MSIQYTVVLGGGARVGTWGLLQGKDIIQPSIADVPNIENPLQAFFYSPSGEQIKSITAGFGEGANLKAKVICKKLGGVSQFELTVLRDNTIPLFTGMEVRLYYKNQPFCYGYVTEIPLSDQTKSEVIIFGNGYAEKLKDVKVSETYSNKTIAEVIADLATKYFNDLGIVYNVNKSQPENVTITDVEFDDLSLYDIMIQLIGICNFNYQTTQYEFGVDSTTEFYFRPLQDKEWFFEGFNYQNPKTNEDSSNIINTVFMFRTFQGVDKQFVTYYDKAEDTESVALYGIREKKLTVPYYTDDTTLDKLATAIIEHYKAPIKNIEVYNLKTDTYLEFGIYGINNKPQTQRNIIDEFNDLDDWTIDDSNSTISIETTRVFTGRRAFKWDIDTSSGDYIEKEFNHIYNPHLLKFYARYADVGTFLRITITGDPGYEENNALYNTDNALVNTDNKIYLTPPAFIYTKDLPAQITNEWIEHTYDLTGLFHISKVKIEIIADDDTTIHLDRLVIYSHSWYNSVLALEEVEYEFGNSSFKVKKANFGSGAETLTKDIEEINNLNSIPLDIFSKQ